MSAAPRRAEFFALEANEYLADLETLAAAYDRPDVERLVRGARALRGAALMAGLGTYARAAAGLEAIGRQVRDHALPWEPAARDAWIEGLSTLRGLVSRAASWEAADDRLALLLADRFEQVLTGRPARAKVAAPAPLTPGVRAFIARESALIAGSFEQASRALAPIPPAAALASVLERLQSLRGLGASAELSPLPELLDAMEVATRTLLADVPAPPDVAAVFADAARALAAMARSVADAGRITPPPELDAVARRLLLSYATEHDVVSIESLAPAGQESIAQRGVAPLAMPETDPIPVELVSVGDHLLLVADALSRPGSPAARDLKLFVLHRTIAAMPSRSATGRFLTPLANAITTAITHNVAADRPDAFVAMLRGCGRFLVDAGSMHDRIALVNRRDAIATSLIMVGEGAAAGAFELPRAPAPTPDMIVGEVSRVVPEPIVDIGSLAPDVVAPRAEASVSVPDIDDDIVDIASLAPDQPDESDVVPIESLAPDAAPLAPPLRAMPDIPADAPGAPSRLEAAFNRRRSLEHGDASGEPTLSGLIGAEIVPIGSLLYRGPQALVRADEVRQEIYVILADPTASLDRLKPHIHELLDLVPLARGAA
ncbi:MAG: Hpt domain-containing protein [Gemmatimonadales bacterium]